MIVVVNGSTIEIAAQSTIAGLLTQQRLSPERVVVELNGVIVKKNAWQTTVLQERDTVEIVAFVSGG